MTELRWDVPATWCWASANEIADIVGGGTPSTRDEANFSDSGIPWITPADLTGYQRSHIERGSRDLSEKGYRSSGAQLMPTGTVLFSSRAPIGYCVIAANELSTNQGFKSFVLKGNISPNYVRYYLLASKEYAESLASGTTFKELSGSRIAELALPIAPLAEQRRIVSKLDSLLDAAARARGELNRIPALIARCKQHIITAAFDGELTREWREKNRLTEQWTSRTVGSLLDDIVAGKNLRCEERPPNASEKGVVKVSAVTWGEFDPHAAKTLPETFDPPEKTRVRSGDLLISRANTLELVGAVVLVRNTPPNPFLSDKILRLETADEHKHWLLWFLRSRDGRNQIEKGATGNQLSMRNLSQAALSEILVPWPSPRERNEVVRRIEVAFAWLERVAAEQGKARRLMPRLDQAILNKAFRGELVPQDPNDEPAARLLERVRAERADLPKRGRNVRLQIPGTEMLLTVRTPTVHQKDHNVNKTRKDVPPSYLCDIIRKSGGEMKSVALWRASEMQIDEFYKLLRDDVAANRLKESEDKASIINAN